MKNRRSFTLLEVLIAITCFFLLLVVIINIYTKMIRLKYNIQARTNVVQDAYLTIEKIGLLLKDYTIDYEEYFNRKQVGCNNLEENFVRDTGIDGYCKNFTAYGNKNYIHDLSSSNKHELYFCSSTAEEESPYKVIKDTEDTHIEDGSGCTHQKRQSYGQYRRQFRDVKNDADTILGAPYDDDDENVMKGPDAIENATGVQELYLISQDGTSRVFIRRILIASGDWNRDGIISGDSEKLYTLQILKLRGFDAGENHDFDATNSSGVYDGKIDTRACDYAQGFVCNGDDIGSLYEGYHLPQDENDGWTNLFQKNITISNWNLTIYPTKNPQYALAENNMQINPYFTINFTSKLYGDIRQKRLGIEKIDEFQINLQTTFNTKNFYTK